MTYAEQLEQETEEARQNLANTLDELRGRISPGQLIDQLTDGLKDGAPGEFARNLKDQAVKNPLPVAIMGISLAWMMLGSRGRSGQGMMDRAADRVREAAGTVADKVRSTADGAGGAATEKASEWTRGMSDGQGASAGNGKGDGSWVDSARGGASEMAKEARDALGSLSGSAQRAASDTYEGIAESGRRTAASVSDSTRAAGRRTLEAGSSIVEFCREQPLLTTAIGIAMGAFLGALAPSTDIEDRAMGEASDGLKEKAKNLAAEQVEKAGEQALSTQEKRDTDASAPDANVGLSDNGSSATLSDDATLVPEEPTAPGEPYERASNADRAAT